MANLMKCDYIQTMLNNYIRTMLNHYIQTMRNHYIQTMIRWMDGDRVHVTVHCLTITYEQCLTITFKKNQAGLFAEVQVNDNNTYNY
jgi:hypothetical protein